jgi:hypothetical protein
MDPGTAHGKPRPGRDISIFLQHCAPETIAHCRCSRTVFTSLRSSGAVN